MSGSPRDFDRLTPLQKAVLALKESQGRLAALESAASEPIAVIGLGCRLPGGANDPEAFWRLLRGGVDAIREVPPDRWGPDAFYDPDPDAPGKMYTKSGGFLDHHPSWFDASFFGISPREAVNMDPQQRLLLEVSWEALENAGQAHGGLIGSRTGVFVGISTWDYVELNFADLARVEAYTGTGDVFSVAAGRLSYTLGLQGPNFPVDTACSSSLVAAHLACQSLRQGECQVALVAGVNLMLTPTNHIFFSKLRALSPDGRCKTFDRAADGYARGEGCGVVVLKRLSDAIRDRDNVVALIRGSAVNHDGRSNGLTAPNGLAQERVIRDALAAARVEPAQVSYVEAHGTGTSLGDPVELQALGAVLGEGRPEERRFTAGSVKTNIGHLEAAAGIAGLIKVVLMLQHREIPPHLHLSEPNPYIPWGRIPADVATELTPWPEWDGSRLAGLSSFGFSGTNAHLVLEQAPAAQTTEELADPPAHLLTLSAKSAAALQTVAERFRDHLSAHPDVPLADVCQTANAGRSAFAHRLAVVAESSAAMAGELATFAAQKPSAWVLSHQVTGSAGAEPPRVAFLFSGQGSQYAGMGRRLFEDQPTFRETLQRCDEILRPHLDRSLLAVLYGEPDASSLIDRTAYAQPALFALEVALAELWRSWGIVPAVVMGHSVGELVAACIAGVFSLEDGLKLIAERGRLMQALPRDGEMAAVFAGEDEVAPALEQYREAVSIAALNGPRETVISGRCGAVAEILEALAANGIKSRRLRVSHAFHSPLMQPVLESFERTASEVRYAAPRIELISNLNGRLAGEEIREASYWRRHVRQPVRFAAGIETLREVGCEVLIEVGPQPALLALARRCWPDAEALWLPSLRRGRDDWQQMLKSLGALHIRGIDVDWAGFERAAPRRKAALPTYPFQRQRFWFEGTPRRFAPTEESLPPLLGRRLRSPFVDGILFEASFSATALPFLTDHRIYDTLVVAGACHLSMALAAATEAFGSAAFTFADVTFPRALVLPEDAGRTVQVRLPSGDAEATFELSGRAQGEDESSPVWHLHATGRFRVEAAGDGAGESSVSLQKIQERCRLRPEAAAGFYRTAEERGLALGPSFQWFGDIYHGRREALCRMQSPETADADAIQPLHPGLLDACIQLLALLFTVEDERFDVAVPFSLDSFRCFGQADLPLWCHAVAHPSDAASGEQFRGDFRLLDATGRVVARGDGLALRPADRETLLGGAARRFGRWIYELQWRPQARRQAPEPAASPGSWLIFLDRGGVGARLAELLTKRGQSPFLVVPGESDGVTEDGLLRIDPLRRADFERLIAEALPADMPFRGVIHLWGLDATPPPELESSSLREAQALGCGSVLHLVQALTRAGGARAPGLWLVTRGAQAVTAEPESLAIAQAPLWGLGRVIALERPELSCVRVDLSPGTEDDPVSALLDEILAGDGEDQVAFHGGERYVARLVRGADADPAQTPEPLASAGTCLITGGLGGLGLCLARWLVERGARHLVLMGRHGASETAEGVLRQLEATGARVTVALGDVSREDDLGRVLAEIEGSGPPLRGIVHAAGVLDDGVLEQQDWQRFARVMAPKVDGAWNLHVQTRGQALDFFVVFSSVASLLGSPGQGNYAAANAFLDALAQHRRRQGLSGLSINWGPWAEVGMASALTGRERRRWTSLGMRLLAPDHGLEILGQVLRRDAAQLAVLPIDWRRVPGPASGGPPVLSGLARGTRDDPGRASAKSPVMRELREAPAGAHRRILQDHVRRQVSRVLELEATASLEPEQPLGELGLDSLMALELRNVLGASLGQTLPSTLLFDFPTVAALTDYLAREVLALESAPPHGPLRSSASLAPAAIDPGEPIAVIGVGCRFPAGADSPDAFWQLLIDGVDAVTEVPPDRWDVEALYDPDPDVPGKTTARYGAFLEAIDRFDASFFGISPREAASMDPQHRLLLEVSWEALENAGLVPGELAGSLTGVFVGIASNDYLQLQVKHRAAIDAYFGTGMAQSTASGRISYLFGFEGPNIAIDTACSSALVATHYACQGLRAGECDLALAGGVNAILSPELAINFSKARMLAPDGRCKTFDQAADGYVRGEGCGIVVLKRLADALRDGDSVLALIRGSAVNQDGRSSGFTVPNGPAQEAVIRRSLASGGVEPAEVSYVETHGTGTSLGDPIEVLALGHVLSDGRSEDDRVPIGSVKTNVGHLEAAAGAAGLIKVVLALQHGEIPPHLHFREPNPHIPWDQLPVEVATERRPWPVNGSPNGRPVAGVSSFAFSGTNAHVVLQGAPERPHEAPAKGRPRHLLALSAKSAGALAESARRLAGHLAVHAEQTLSDVCHSANVGRSRFEHRLALNAATSEEMVERLASFAAGRQAPGVLSGRAGEPPRVAFLFTGQGSQYPGMGRQLYDTQPAFRATLERCQELLRPHLKRPLLSVLYPEADAGSPLDETAYTQPALVALELALAELWRSWGVAPAVVMGHSVGEIAAACIAGVFSFEDGLKLAADRGRLMEEVSGVGAMAAVFAGEEQVAAALESYRESVSIAALNGPRETVVSGSREAVGELLEALAATGIKSRRLRTSHAFHSPQMEPMLDVFERVASRVAYAVPNIELISSLSGRPVAEEVCAATYWRRHARQPVKFEAGMRALRETGCDVLLEVGPQATLLAMARKCWPDSEGLWLPSLRRGRDDWQQMLKSLGALHARGMNLDWRGFDADYPCRRVALPTYPFERQRYWFTSGDAAPDSDPPFPVPGRRLQTPFVDGFLFEAAFSTAGLPRLSDHRVFDTLVVPAAGQLAMILAAAEQAFGAFPCILEEVAFSSALVVPEDGVRTVQVRLPAEDSASASFELSSLAQESDGEGSAVWTSHAAGRLRPDRSSEGAAGEQVPPEGDKWTSSPAEIQARCQRRPGAAASFYRTAEERGLDLGPSFRWLAEVHLGRGEALCRIRPPAALDAEAEAVQPMDEGVLDSCIQLLALLLAESGAEFELAVPFGLDRFGSYRRLAFPLWCHATASGRGSAQERLRGGFRLLDAEGRVVAAAEGLSLQRTDREALFGGLERRLYGSLYELQWRPQVLGSAAAPEAAAGRWLVFADRAGAGERLAGLLAERRASPVLVLPGEVYVAGDNAFQLNPAKPGDFERLIAEATTEDRPLRGAVHLWGLDMAPEEEPALSSLREAQAQGCGSVLHLVQALTRAHGSSSTRLWLVTRGAQAVGPAAPAVAQAPLWGLGRVIALERPELRCARIDLDPGAGDASVETLVEEILAAEGEDQVAFRGGERLVARLERGVEDRPEAPPEALAGDATYLVTGGLGGLGLLVARWLVERGARHLVLMSRRPASAAAALAVSELEAAGARVVAVAGDVSRPDDVAAVLDEIARSDAPLRGIVHAAGVLDDGVLEQQSWQRFAAVMAPKVDGAWNLHLLTLDLPLDFFVAFSSVAALLGAPGQGNYAAANAFLDALAHHRRARGLPALSVNWGPWADVGMAASLGRRERRRWSSLGMRLLTPDQGLEILGRILERDDAQLAVLPIDWRRVPRPADGGPALLGELARGRRAPVAGGATAGEAPDLRRRLDEAPAGERRQVLLSHVRELAAGVLELASPASLELERPLGELGLDSLMALELRNALGAGLGQPLPATLVFDHPTVKALTDYLAREVLALRSLPSPASPERAPIDAGEPIAILGMGCRFPAGADTPEAAWELLRDGVDAITEVPAERWDIEEFYDSDPDAPGKMSTRHGGFLEGIDRFDAGFFGIAPREAVSMDPQHRLLMEVSWEALESAGLVPEELAGSSTGVFVGMTASDYLQLQLAFRDISEIDAYFGTGTAQSTASGRLSYLFGLEGPNVAVDTACSSSLVALHYACQSLRTGECDLALAGGVNATLIPEVTINFSKARMLAADGRCKTFDQAADGYVRGEGCGIVVLKRLSEALRDGDPVLAVVRGSAVNQDGRSTGLTVPNGPAQEAVIRRAMANAGVEPGEVSYVEAHGTGTSLGDPIEVQALARALGEGRAADERLLIGSVKTNFGHLEAAAGIAGLIKVVLALRHGEIPPHLHFKEPNRHIPWEAIPVEVAAERRPWTVRAGARRIAGVSSFGFSGTNAHAVLEEAPERPAAQPGADRPLHLLTLSAKSAEALGELAGRLASDLASRPDDALGDVCYSANAGRSRFAHRLAVTAASPPQMAERLARFAGGQAAAAVLSGRVDDEHPPKVAFLFTGQGSQYPGMGLDLYRTEPTFRAALERCDALLRPHLERPLLSVLYPSADDRSLLDQTAYTQPALFALGVALAELWRSWGIEPAVVMGHSVGELAAACVAGVFDLENGLELIAARGRLMQDLPRDGAMAAVAAGEQDVAAVLEAHRGSVSVSALNGPRETVISGAKDAVADVLQALSSAEVKSRHLRVSHAFHSPLVEPMLDAFFDLASRVSYVAPALPLVSNLSGGMAGEEVSEASYWRRHAREPVRFEAGMRTVREAGCDVLLEIGPQPTLLAMGKRCWGEDSGTWVPSLRKNRDGWPQMLDSLGALYLRGVDVDWQGFDRGYGRSRVALPAYPFQRRRYWFDAGPRRRRAESATRRPRLAEPDDWLYRIDWPLRPLPPAAPEGAPEPGRWLVFADRGGCGERLARRLEAEGDRCLLVFAGDALTPADQRIREVDPARPADFEWLLREASDARAEPAMRGIVHLWGLDADGTTAESLEAAQVLGCASVLHLFQALAAGGSPPPRLWLITRGAQAVASETTASGLVQAALWGLGPVAASEMPELQSTLIDLSPEPDDSEADRLAEEIRHPDGEDRLAYRAGRRHVARLAPYGRPAEPSASLALRAQATYLITGGLGALGLRVARWLVERGARHLVLAGRRDPGERAAAALDGLRELGAEAVAARCDVARPEDVARLLSEVETSMPPLAGIVHAAGVLDDGVLLRLDWRRFDAVLAPKVAGAWNLHQESSRLALDFFVLFSSAAALLAPPGQGNYAAANAFLGALAHHRRGLGLPATSLDWGPWAEAGMAASSAADRRRRSIRGLGALSPDQALQALERALSRDLTQAGVLAVDWRKLLDSFPGGGEPPLLAEVPGGPRPAGPAPDARPGLLERLRETPATERLPLLQAAVRGAAARVLGLEPGQSIEPRQGFFDLGMDSLMVVELRNRLQAELGAEHPLPTTLIFDHPTVEDLADYLAAEVLGSTPAAAERRRGAVAEPIAIIGLGCRFPGGADDPEAFWRLLRDGVDAITEVPEERWDIDAFYDPDPAAAGKMSTRCGGFLDGIDRFDPEFFGIVPREAASIDPQHRLLLEVSWEALEHAGQAPSGLAHSRTGVFVGICNSDYTQRRLQVGDPATLEAHLGTGSASSAAAGRVSYLLGLTGPSLAVDTACSSSAVAVHLACRSLERGECDLALAGGVNVILSPEPNVILSKARMLAADGRCKTFDAAADGYVRSEGCGMVVLKPLSRALADGDRVLAVVRGSAVNQDGRSVGLTAPNGTAQEAVIREALTGAGVEPREVGYVEAHGTGTALGDPIEVRALGAVLGPGRGADRPVVLGSVKTNLGHLEGAAGVAGLIKTVLALGHEEIPPHLHFHQPSPEIPWHELLVEVARERVPWPAGSGRRVAGVSSFGFIGTNAHLVVEEAPARERPPAPADRGFHLLPLSAANEEALAELARRVAATLEARPSLPLADVCFTAGAGRAHLDHRLAAVADTSEAMAGRLAAFAGGAASAGLVSARVRSPEAPKLAFLFSGQGSQYAGMGRGLYESQPIFRQILDCCDELLRPMLERSLLSVLYPLAAEESSLLDETAYTQPALFALQIALAELWRSWGVTPSVVMGHSVGEYAAACVAGVFSLEDGLKLIAERGRLMQSLPRDGAMVAIFASEERVSAALEPHAGQVAIAAVNGPREVVISGAREAVSAAVAALEAEAVETRRLKVSHAFHSPLMEPILEPFERAAAAVSYSRPEVGLISNLSGRPVSDEHDVAADYWRRHVRRPVRFADGTETLRELGFELLLEIGPRPTLLGLGRKSWPRDRGVWLPSLRKNLDDSESMLRSLAELYVRGLSVDWRGLEPGESRSKVALPTYPFQRRRYWMKDGARRSAPARAASLPPLPGRRISSPLIQEPLFEFSLDRETLPFLADHRIFGRIVVPGACHLSTVLLAAEQAFGPGSYVLEDVTFPEAIELPEEGSRGAQLQLPAAGAPGAFNLFSSTGEPEDGNASWTLHATGTLRAAGGGRNGQSASREEIEARFDGAASAAESFYETAWQAGLELGPAFRWIDKIWRRDGESLGLMARPEALRDAAAHECYPGLIDACFQLLGAPAGRDADVYVPIACESLRWYGRPGAGAWCHAVSRPSQGAPGDTLSGDFQLFDAGGRPVLEVVGALGRRAPREALIAAERDDWLYEVRWQRRERADEAPERKAGGEPGSWLVLSDGAGVGGALCELLEARGAECLPVVPGEAFERSPEGCWKIDPGSPEDFKRLLGDVAGSAERPLRGVVHLWSLDVDPSEERVAEAGQRLGCGSALYLIQALAGAPRDPAPGLWLVTRGAQATADGRAVEVAQATLWGLGRVAAIEAPDLWGGLVDLDDGVPEIEAARLVEEIWQPIDRQDQVAFRGGRRLIARLARSPRPEAPAAPPAIDAEGTYLVTGGLGALGLLVARWLVEQGARHLVLAGRGGASETASEALIELESAGARVVTERMDVSRAADVARTVERIGRSMPPLRGVVHAAGVLDDGVLVQQDWQRFARVLAPKVQGGFNLHAATAGLSLDFFLLFSSMASLIGSPGQANYSAANAFLDALAHHRRSRGLPAVSINWGPWGEAGMATRHWDRRRWASQGLSLLTPDQGLRALARALCRDRAQIAVLPVDWPRLAAQFPAGGEPSLIADLARRAEPAGAPRRELLERLEAASAQGRDELLLAYLRQQVSQVLELTQPPDPQQGLFDMGMDSLMALDLRNRLQTELGVPLPATLVFESPSIESLAVFFRDALFLDAADDPGEFEEAPEDPELAALLAEIEELADDEVDREIEALDDDPEGLAR